MAHMTNEYESFSDWEPCGHDSGHENPQIVISRPLSFVLVEDDKPSVVEHRRATPSDGRPKKTLLNLPSENVERLPTHSQTTSRYSPRTHKPSGVRSSTLLTPKTASHNAELNINVPVYDVNDRIPRHNRAHCSRPSRNVAGDASLVVEEVFTGKRSSAALKNTDLYISNNSSSERPTSKRTKPPASTAPMVMLGVRGSSIPERSATSLAVSEKDSYRLGSTTEPITLEREKARDSPPLNPNELLKPKDNSALHAHAQDSFIPEPNRSLAPPDNTEHRRYAAPCPRRQHDLTLEGRDGANERTPSTQTGKTKFRKNMGVHTQNRSDDPTHLAHDRRTPFGMPPRLVGAPSFPRLGFVMPIMPPESQLGFGLSGMNRTRISAPGSMHHGLPNPHFSHGGANLGPVADESIHGFSSETMAHLNTMHHASFLPLSPMTPMIGYQRQLSMHPFLPQVPPHMPMNPFERGNVFHNQTAHFNPALSTAPVPRNPFPDDAAVITGSDSGFASIPAEAVTLHMATPPVGDVANRKALDETKKSADKTRTSSESLGIDFNQKVEKEDTIFRRRKQLVKKQQAKKATDRSVDEVDEIPCDDEEDGVDYVSRLTQIQQKKFLSLPVPLFFPVQAKDGGGSGWKCVMTAKLLNKSPSEELATIKVARNQRRAKRAAAKELLSSLESRIPELFSSETSGKQNVQAMKSQSAVNVIQLLVRDGHLPCLPNCETEEVNDTDEDRWRCSATLFTNDHGRKIFVEYGPSKSTAKKKWARKALEILIQLKVPGVEQYRCVLDPMQATAKKTMAGVPKASEVIVRTSDDEEMNDSCDDIVEDMDFTLTLPSDYELVLAKTEADCEKWFDIFAQPGAELGVFIDSKSARLAVEENYTSQLDSDLRKVQRPILCFSTASSCIIIRADKKQASGNGSEPDEAPGAFWVPEVVAETLEDPRVQKAALGPDDGLDLLVVVHGIHCASVQDIAVSSLAITGYGRVGSSRNLPSLRDLTKYWMRKEAKDLSWKAIWPSKQKWVEERLSRDKKEAAMAVLSSYATFCVREKVCDAARLKRMNAPGASNDLEVLSRRIVQTEAG
ncbi:unnamed protein product [Agarophyton chilense]|eukprot:gb/GEZJ01000676.1/.p1 GENE.gb/GEZJ01000676.1/~~gb/GEZJ01000676.1/.p1  ORF type:complete len:1076 (+),score=148.73 gb/GEZJ01000676.1/:194-3421(+)